MRVEGGAAAKPLRHVLDHAQGRRRGQQRLARVTTHLVPPNVEHAQRHAPPAQRRRELVRVGVAPAVAEDPKLGQPALIAAERIAQSLDRRGGVLAPPLPVDAAQLVLPQLERAQWVVGLAQPAAYRDYRLIRVGAVAVGVEPAVLKTYAVFRDLCGSTAPKVLPACLAC